MKKNPIITGTLILTATGLLTRVIGFFYRIYLSQNIGDEQMGIYQLIAPVMALSFSFTVAGIQTSISKHTAAYHAKHDTNSSISILLCGLIISVFLSLVTGFYIFEYSDYISEHFLLEIRCSPLVKTYALSIPFAAIHSCINGYYYGLKKTAIPSVTQLIEQLVRVISVFFIFDYCKTYGFEYSVSIAIIGLVIGEIISCLVSIIAISITEKKLSSNSNCHPMQQAKPLLLLATPLCINRITINFLQSIEAVYLPAKLLSYGLTNSQALSIYGVLTGMALPLILFPQAVTNSISVLILPYVSEADAGNNSKKISKAIISCTSFCILLGFLAFVLFYFTGDILGTYLFHSNEVGVFIRSLSFICPFLYLGSLLTSILNGLNKATLAFFINILALMIRLIAIFLFVPQFGIKAYLWGVLASQIVHCICNYLALHKYIYYNKSVCSIKNRCRTASRKRQ